MNMSTAGYLNGLEEDTMYALELTRNLGGGTRGKWSEAWTVVDIGVGGSGFDPESTMDPSSRDTVDTDSSSTDSSTSGSGSANGRKKGVPYIPSYMDLTNGPEPCVVCSDAATGYHYRCMTCEGCKGFFRRTIQKNLKYHCKWNGNCIIDKTTRNQCQECRFQKCMRVGMACDLVLNEKQRKAKRKLIEENRERKKHEQFKVVRVEQDSTIDQMTDMDRGLISDICTAYEATRLKTPTVRFPMMEYDSGDSDSQAWQQLAEVMTPSIVKVVEFAKGVPGFVQLYVDDQILLLKSCCMEVMCLRAACRFDPGSQALVLPNGLTVHKSSLHKGSLGILVEPIFEFALGLAKLELDQTEVALLAAVLLMQSDRSGLKEPEAVEKLQDAILGAYKRYIAENRPHQPVHWAKVLMKVTDLRTISTRHAERVLCVRMENMGSVPPMFLEMFREKEAETS